MEGWILVAGQGGGIARMMSGYHSELARTGRRGSFPPCLGVLLHLIKISRCSPISESETESQRGRPGGLESRAHRIEVLLFVVLVRLLLKVLTLSKQMCTAKDISAKKTSFLWATQLDEPTGERMCHRFRKDACTLRTRARASSFMR